MAAFQPLTASPPLEHFPEKWTPVFRKEMRPTSKLAAAAASVPAPRIVTPHPDGGFKVVSARLSSTESRIAAPARVRPLRVQIMRESIRSARRPRHVGVWIEQP